MDNSQETKDLRLKRLFFISLIFAFFFLVLHSRSPVQDGNSFEYAGLARNIFRSAGLREDLLSSYTVKDQALPHPASLRANLWAFFLVPFYVVFRDTPWTFLIPAALGLFLLPLAVYRIGGKFFNRDIAFYAAVLSLFSPTLLRYYTLLDPGQPEIFQMIFYLLFLASLLEDRFIAAGFWMAIAFLFKMSSIVLIPAAVVWLLIFSRKKLFSPPMLKVFLTAFIIVLPFLARNAYVFGSPFHTDQFTGFSKIYQGRMIDRVKEGDLLGIIFNYDEYNKPVQIDNRFSVRVKNHFRVMFLELKMAVAGVKTDTFFMPGVFQTIGLVIFPFFLIGIYVGRKSRAVSLALLISVFQIVSNSLFLYSDIYILAILPFVFLIAGTALKRIEEIAAEVFPPINNKSLAWCIILFSIITESSAILVFCGLRLKDSPRQSVYVELETVCNRLRSETAPGDVIMTFPFFSTHYLCDRPTAPLPYSSLGSMAEIIKKYNAKHIVFSGMWPGDLFPQLPFTKEVVRGKKIALSEVDPALLENYLKNPASYPLTNLNLMKYFISNRLDFEISPPLYKTLAFFSGGVLSGFLIYFFLALLFIYFFQKKSFFLGTFPIIIFCIFCILSSGFYIFDMFKSYASARPFFSFVEAKMNIEQLPESLKDLLIFSNPGADPAMPPPPLAGMEKLFKRTSSTSELMPEPLKGKSLVFIPIRTSDLWISDDMVYAAAEDFQKKQSEAVANLVKEYDRKGFKSIPIYGGLLVY